jgi:hypothetical protein
VQIAYNGQSINVEAHLDSLSNVAAVLEEFTIKNKLKIIKVKGIIMLGGRPVDRLGFVKISSYNDKTLQLRAEVLKHYMYGSGTGISGTLLNIDGRDMRLTRYSILTETRLE